MALTPSTLNVCPMEIDSLLLSVLSYFDPLELSSSIALVSQAWNKLILNNRLIWMYHCDMLWKNKLFITSKAVEMRRTRPSDAFKISYQDRERNVINLQELTSIKWQFRFKNDVQSDDDKMTVSFMSDGSIIHQNLPSYLGGEFGWKFVKETCTKKPFSLQRSNRFSSLNDFDVNSKNSTGCKAATNHGYQREGDNDYRFVQINRFEPFCVYREAKGWGYILQNKQCILSS